MFHMPSIPCWVPEGGGGYELGATSMRGVAPHAPTDGTVGRPPVGGTVGALVESGEDRFSVAPPHAGTKLKRRRRVKFLMGRRVRNERSMPRPLPKRENPAKRASRPSQPVPADDGTGRDAPSTA